MQHTQLDVTEGFRVSIGNARAQAAVMVIAAGQSEGGADNRHRGADQWLLVLAGTGVAIVAGAEIALRAGTLVLIEAGERHEVRNTGGGLLETISIYLPPAYTSEGEETVAGSA